MSLSHEFLVGFAKSFGLFWLFGLLIVVILIVFWPTWKKRFDRAAKSILDDDEGPVKHPDQAGPDCDRRQKDTE